MQILLFVLTAVLVGYVVYTFYSSNAGQASNLQPENKSNAVEPEPAKKPEPRERKKPAAKSEEPAPAQSEPMAASTESSPAPTLYRNPNTGETAAVPSNYRFAKKWIKEALVAEGLLARVYKNNELDGKISRQVKEALDKFREIKKYHA